VILDRTLLVELSNFWSAIPFGELCAAFAGAFAAFKLESREKSKEDNLQKLASLNFVQMQILINCQRILIFYRDSIRGNIRDYDCMQEKKDVMWEFLVKLLPRIKLYLIKTDNFTFCAVTKQKTILFDIAALNTVCNELSSNVEKRNKLLAPFYHADRLGKEIPSHDTIILLHNYDVNIRSSFADYLNLASRVSDSLFSIGKENLPRKIIKDVLIQQVKETEEFNKLRREILSHSNEVPMESVTTEFMRRIPPDTKK
jgi:hypothetical protein